MMKNIKIRTIALLVVSISLFSSCSKDFLEPKPTTALENDEVFKSLTNAKVAMIGAYDQFSSYYFDGLYLPIMSDLMGEDLMLNSERNYNWFVAVYQMQLLPNYQYSSNPWSKGYKILYDANRIVEGANIIPDASREEKEELIAEAKVMRAFVMLKLVQMFAPAYSVDANAPGILLVTTPLDYDAPDIKRSTVGDVYNQIVADLSYAVDKLPAADYGETGFFGKRAAHAILARTYLDMQEWANARDNAKLAYDGLELMSMQELVGGFYSSNSETIFSVSYTPEDNNVYLSIPSFYWPVAGYSSMRADVNFVNRFNKNDARSYQFQKIDQIDPDNWLILKFQHNQQVGNAERISIRASEMYLIEAEAEAELNNYSVAQDALYKIQSRAYPGVQKPISTGQDLIDEILIERRKELFGEGFRLNDIKRRNLAVKREGDHWVKFDYNPNDADYYRFTFPIPQKEIDANSALTQDDQNIGY